MEEEAGARAITSWMADWVVDFAAPCYGPRGQSKLIDLGGGEGRILKSGASALREAGIVHPDLQPYVELAAAVQEHAGDQATGALLLAARLVRGALAGADAGVPIQAYLDGYALALRQARAQIAAIAVADAEGRSLGSVAPHRPRLAPLVLEGLRGLASRGEVLLDSIDVRAEARLGAEEAWLPGVLLEPQHEPRGPRGGERPAKVLLLSDDWRPGPWKQDFSYRMEAGVPLDAWTGMEDERRRRAVAHVLGLGATVVVCSRAIDVEACEMLARKGVLVWKDASLSALQRLERATGGRANPRLMDAAADELGKGTLRPRPDGHGWVLEGAGPSSTLVIPAETEPGRDQARDDGERLLRAAGSFLQDPVAVPGGGRWQRGLAASLRKAADAAPGKSPMALREAAKAVDALADDLVRNLGLDPLDEPLPPDAGGVLDVARSVRVAVAGAFEMALQVLRIDDRFRKRESEGGWLRGGDKASLVEAGDVPPLM